MNQGALHICKSNGSVHPASVESGKIFIISAPSGAGKTTLCNVLRKHFPDLAYSVSFTTREPRSGEKHGIDYFFITPEEFVRRINANLWAEWAKVHDNYYGTSLEYIENGLRSGKDILLDIDVQGTLQLLKRYPESVTIFIMPPSVGVLKERMAFRGADTDEVIKKRLINAESEIAQRGIYRHVIVNDLLEETEKQLIELVATYRRSAG